MSKKRFEMVNGQMRKLPGWFSWRHQSSAEHLASRERYQAERGPAARRRKALERLDPSYVPHQTWDESERRWMRG